MAPRHRLRFFVASAHVWDLLVRAKNLFGIAMVAKEVWARSNPAPTTAPLAALLSQHGLLQTVRQSGKDDYDKFSLPTGSGLPEDILEGGARPFIGDAEFGRSGSQFFSCDEMEC
jgi:hypothetical protein